MDDDKDRDLKADLVLCEKATPGPWGYEHIHGEAFSCGRRGLQYLERGTQGTSDDVIWAAAARTGWPAAIRRALAAEALLRRIATSEDDGFHNAIEEAVVLYGEGVEEGC